MKTTNVIDAVAELNGEIFETSEKLAEKYFFESRSTGFADAIIFNGVHIWDSEGDGRPYNKDTDERMGLKQYCKQQVLALAKDINTLFGEKENE